MESLYYKNMTPLFYSFSFSFFKFLFLIFLFLLPQSYNKGLASDSPSNSSTPSLEKLLEEFPYLQALQKQCDSNSSPQNVANCIWNKASGAQKKQIKEFFKGGLSLKASTTYAPLEDPLLSQFLEKYREKIREYHLQGEKKKDPEDNSLSVGNHYSFYALANDQLNKNMMSLISGQCLEIRPSDIDKKKGTISVKFEFMKMTESDYEKNLNQNRIAILNNFSLAQKFVESCLSHIKGACDRKGTSSTYTKQKACEILKAFNDQRVASTHLEAIQEKLREHSPDTTKRSQNAPSLDSVTTIKATDLLNVEKEGQKSKEIAQELKKLEECQKDPKSKQCQSFFLSGTEAKEFKKKATLEIMAMKAQEELFQEAMKDPKKHEELLKKMGQSWGIEDLEKKKDLIQKVYDSFQKEKESLIGRINETVKQKIMDETKGPTQEQISETKAYQEKRQEYFKNMLHFSNIVSSLRFSPTPHQPQSTNKGQNGQQGAKKDKIYANKEIIQEELRSNLMKNQAPYSQGLLNQLAKIPSLESQNETRVFSNKKDHEGFMHFYYNYSPPKKQK